MSGTNTAPRRTVGYVFQDLNLLPALTAVENVMLPRELDGVPSRQARREAHEALVTVDVEDLADRYPDELSGGQQQRIAIARALVGPRRIVLADEPTGALDSTSGEQILRLLRRPGRRGRRRAAGDPRGPARRVGGPRRLLAGRPRGRRRRSPGRTGGAPPRARGGRAMSSSLAPLVPGRASRWRGLLRIARRDARRHLGRSILVAVLVGLPVLLLSALSVVVRSNIAAPTEVAAQLLPAASQVELDVRSPGNRLSSPWTGRTGTPGTKPGQARRPQPWLGRGTRTPPTRSSPHASQPSCLPGTAWCERSPGARRQGGFGSATGRSRRACTRSRTSGLCKGRWTSCRGRLRTHRQRSSCPGGCPGRRTSTCVLGLNQFGVTALSRAVAADPPPPERVPYEQGGSWGATLQEALFVAVL
jgi:hypothetical protein